MVTVDKVAGTNAVIAGLFLGGAAAAPAVRPHAAADPVRDGAPGLLGRHVRRRRLRPRRLERARRDLAVLPQGDR